MPELELTTTTGLLMAGIIWLSGVFVWLIKRFVDSFEKNTVVMAKVDKTLDAMDRKIDASTERDLEMLKTIEKIAARQEFVHYDKKGHDHAYEPEGL